MIQWDVEVSWEFESIMKRSLLSVEYGDNLYFIFTEIYGLPIPYKNLYIMAEIYTYVHINCFSTKSSAKPTFLRNYVSDR